MTKKLSLSLLIILLALCLQTAQVAAYQDPATPANLASDSNLTNINPFTGLPVKDPAFLTYPPVLIPISRYPDENRPSAGYGQAPWVFEMYVNAGESRPMALFFGSLPESSQGTKAAYVGSLSGAVLGLESLRKQYLALLITTGNAQHIVDAGLLNIENWYGLSGDQKYPDLPVTNLKNYLEKWKKRLVAPDLAGLMLPFSYGLPFEGKPGSSLYMRYASFNQILWEFDAANGLYHRSQNANADPEIVADIDALTGNQVAVQNLVILFADHTVVDNEGNFTVNFNYVDKKPALVFRDGVLYEIFWTTRSEAYERETEKMRPIRLIDADGNPFPLKPGSSWVHVLSTGNPYYEISGTTGNEVSVRSGHWKIPYISVKPGEKEIALAENSELEAILEALP